jgi:hypothetical protein
MQCSVGPNHRRSRAKASIRRNPVSSKRRIAAKPVGCSPLCCGLTKHLPELTEFLGIQPPLPPFSRKLSNPFGRISRDNLQPGGMTEKAAQRADRAARRASAARCGRLDPFAPRRLAGGDVGLHPFDVVKRAAPHHPRPEEWLDVCLDPTKVHLQRRCLYRS